MFLTMSFSDMIYSSFISTEEVLVTAVRAVPVSSRTGGSAGVNERDGPRPEVSWLLSRDECNDFTFSSTACKYVATITSTAIKIRSGEECCVDAEIASHL